MRPAARRRASVIGQSYGGADALEDDLVEGGPVAEAGAGVQDLDANEAVFSVKLAGDALGEFARGHGRLAEHDTESVDLGVIADAHAAPPQVGVSRNTCRLSRQRSRSVPQR